MSEHEIYSAAAEQAVLGGLLLNNDAVEHLTGLQPDHFYLSQNRRVYGAVMALITAGDPADVLTVYDHLGGQQAEDLTYLNDLTRSTPGYANIGHHAGIVRDRAQRRGVLALAADLQREARETVGRPAGVLIDFAQSRLEALASARTVAGPRHVSDGLMRFVEDLQRQEDGTGQKPISTGFPDLDHRMSGGMRRGELIVVAARPKMGKTALALNIAANVARTQPVLVQSMEMPEQQLHQRNVASLGRVDLGYLLNVSTIPSDPMANDEVWSGIVAGTSAAQALHMYVDDQGGCTLLDVRTKARSVKRQHGLDLLVLDYLQLMSGEGDNRNAEIEGITRGLKALAKELDIVIMLLSQLNRGLESRPNKRPIPSDLRDSGAIEQDADAVLFIYRDEVYHPDTPDRGTAEIDVALIRQGQPGRVRLAYVGAQTRFDNLALGWRSQEPAEPVTRRRGRSFEG